MGKLYRNDKHGDALLFGVLGGIGDYLNIDSTIVRVIFVCLLIFSPYPEMLMILYVILGMCLEKKDIQNIEIN